MKIRLAVIALAVALLIAVGLSGCAGKGDEASSGSSKQESASNETGDPSESDGSKTQTGNKYSAVLNEYIKSNYAGKSLRFKNYEFDYKTAKDGDYTFDSGIACKYIHDFNRDGKPEAVMVEFSPEHKYTVFALMINNDEQVVKVDLGEAFENVDFFGYNGRNIMLFSIAGSDKDYLGIHSRQHRNYAGSIDFFEFYAFDFNSDATVTNVDKIRDENSHFVINVYVNGTKYGNTVGKDQAQKVMDKYSLTFSDHDAEDFPVGDNVKKLFTAQDYKDKYTIQSYLEG